MSVNDLVSDLLVRVLNAEKIKAESVDVLASKLIKAILEILMKESYISNFKFIDDKKQGLFRVYLKYKENGKGAIKGAKRVSKLGLRKYIKRDAIRRFLHGYGICILSTSKGVMTEDQARESNVGGEIICQVW